jgi:uncharacterized protein YjbJ (UPF0337 family)
MSGTADKIGGKLKQAAGDLTDDKDLKRDGKIEEASGKVKDGLDRTKDKAADAVDSIKDKLK